MAGIFKFELVTPERVLLSENVEQVVLPGSEGDFTVLVAHAPVIATLRPGVIDVQLTGRKQRVFVKGGFADVQPELLVVLAEKALDLDEIDADTVAAELEAAEAELEEAKDDQARLVATTAIEQLKMLQEKKAA
jgi:F-type H+-transporting ATPase subunit epsilon